MVVDVMEGSRGGRRRPGSAASAQGKTAPANDPVDVGTTALALYVTGPVMLGRYLLPDGIVSVGRDASATIVIDDPTVSRTHVALHLGADIEINDLASANGTFVKGRRLVPHRPQPLALGQPFFIGDSALVVRPTSLPRSCANRIRGLGEVRERLTRTGADGRPSQMLVLDVRAVGEPLPPTCEPVLSEFVDGANGWLMWVGQDRVLIGLDAGTDSDGHHTERAVAEALRSWRLVDEVEVRSRLVTRAQFNEAGDSVDSLIDTPGAVTLKRGTVVLRDPAMTALAKTLRRIAAAPINVLVLGETGAGKDVVASMVHELSIRAGKPLVSVNCASLPEGLLESDLFGYDRGAFTGAVGAKPGLLETAEGGTVFLDEIGDLPAPLQAKLLRVIEAHEVTRLGATRARQLDVRFIAATNRDLPQEIAAGRFRQDLYYRLAAMTVTVPPLRERPSEIEPLARLFADSAARRFCLPAPEFSAAAIALLRNHSWPGNARELRNAIERAVLLCAGEVLTPAHLSPLQPPPRAPATSAPLPTSERERIERALAENGWNQSRAAQALGIPRRTLVRRIARFGFPRPRTRGPHVGVGEA